MTDQRKMPTDPLAFIKNCINQRRIFWTYHVNMRFSQRPIIRDDILNAVDSFEIIEEYPEDKYLPSYLIRADCGGLILHVQVAADVDGDNVRIVTTYIPDPQEWDADFRIRRKRP